MCDNVQFSVEHSPVKNLKIKKKNQNVNRKIKFLNLFLYN